MMGEQLFFFFFSKPLVHYFFYSSLIENDNNFSKIKLFPQVPCFERQKQSKPQRYEIRVKVRNRTATILAVFLNFLSKAAMIS